jgi:hypothetical protein
MFLSAVSSVLHPTTHLTLPAFSWSTLSKACENVSTANFAAAAFFLYSYMFSGLFMAGAVGEFALIRFTSIFFYGWEALVANEFRKGIFLVMLMLWPFLSLLLRGVFYFAGSKFLFNPRGVGLSNSKLMVTADALLDNWHLSSDNFIPDTMSMVAFTIACLAATFLVLAKSKFRR